MRIICFYIFIIACSFNCLGSEINYKSSTYIENGPKKDIHSISSENFNFIENSEEIGFGFTAATIWVKVELDQPIDKKLIIDINYPLLDSIIFHWKDGQNWKTIIIGDRVANWKREYISPSLNVTIPENSGQLFYLEIKSESSLTIPLTVNTIEEFYYKTSLESPFYFLYYGLMLVMFIYNFFLFFSLKSKSYLLYCLLTLATVLYQANYNGHAQFFLWGHYIEWSNIAMPLLMGLTIVLSAEFAILFLALEKRLHNWIRVISYLGILTILLSLMGTYTIAIKIASLSTIIGSLSLATVGYITWAKGNKISIYYSIAWSAYLFFLIIGAMRAFGVLPTNYWTYKSSHFGSGIEVLLLAFALAHKYKIIQKEKTNAQHDLIEYQKGITNKLDSQIKERTLHLEKTIGEKNVLLNEIHHRVKNNLQVVTSLLNLHIRKLNNEEAIEALEDSKRRIQVMFEIHEQLYNEDQNLLELDTITYLKQFTQLATISHAKKGFNFQFRSELEVSLSFDKTILLGLIMNEIVVNSIKHGSIAEEQDSIFISIKKVDGFLVFAVINNGPSLPENFTLDKNGSLGIRIILALSNQLNASYSISNRLNSNGVLNTITLN